MAGQFKTFDEVLRAAIDDMADNGFDSMERVTRWTEALRLAAERTAKPADEMEQMLRDGLASIYRRLIERGQIVDMHQGIGRFTLRNVEPRLRAELDRRILASANLIRLNRAESIDRTLRRFQGWATSIPAGGGHDPDKREAKADVKKGLSQLPFEERRVLIDQGHKLTSSLSQILATDGGAIAAEWRSHWRQAGYNYREEHKERDKQVYLVRGSWADDGGLVKKAGRPYYDEITAVGEEPFCRCYVRWIYHLRDLPKDMLTVKGQDALKDAKAAAAAL